MKTAAVSLMLVTLFAGAALAQPATAPIAPSEAPAQASKAPPVAKAPATGTKTVEGLTVMRRPLPTKECSSRDKQCIGLVVAELKRLYPEQLKRFCFQREMRAMRNASDFGDSDPTGQQPPQMAATFNTAAPLAVACARDRK